jgi:hypothetical protein
MTSEEEYRLNQEAYWQVSETLAGRFGNGRFVAFAGGQIVADAERIQELDSILRAQGHDPREALVVQAGVKYPRTAIIL